MYYKNKIYIYLVQKEIILINDILFVLINSDISALSEIN
jgi:hypothetical protein